MLVVLAATSSSVNNVEPGALGFLVVAGIGVALVFLLRSMNKQFRKITPDPSAPGEATAHAEGPAHAEATAHAEGPAAGPSIPS